jgi:hypothetical protein
LAPKFFSWHLDSKQIFVMSYHSVFEVIKLKRADI